MAGKWLRKQSTIKSKHQNVQRKLMSSAKRDSEKSRREKRREIRAKEEPEVAKWQATKLEGNECKAGSAPYKDFCNSK